MGYRSKNSFIHTYSGGRCWPLSPKPEDIDIESIAHSLACSTRFNGHTRAPYSVAQHSWLVSVFCDSRVALEGLMHDSTEAYLGDLVLPVKRSFPEFEKAERALWKVIAEVFDLDPAPFHPSIKEADIRVLATEARDLFGEPTSWMGELRAEPYDLSGLEFGDKIRPWNWLVAKERFLGRFSSLAEKRRTSNGRE